MCHLLQTKHLENWLKIQWVRMILFVDRPLPPLINTVGWHHSPWQKMAVVLTYCSDWHRCQRQHLRVYIYGVLLWQHLSSRWLFGIIGKARPYTTCQYPRCIYIIYLYFWESSTRNRAQENYLWLGHRGPSEWLSKATKFQDWLDCHDFVLISCYPQRHIHRCRIDCTCLWLQYISSILYIHLPVSWRSSSYHHIEPLMCVSLTLSHRHC